MIPVEQRHDFDCMQACLCSIFECPYEEGPVLWEIGESRPREDWYKLLADWLRERGFGLQNFHHTKGDRPQDSPWYFVGYWLGGVWSPRFTDPDNGGPGGHCVVMRGNDLLWDPNPRRDLGHLGFFNADVLIPLDPARLQLKT